MKRREFLRNALVTIAAAPAVTEAIARATEPQPDLMIAYWYCEPMSYHVTPEYVAAIEKMLADVDKQMGIPAWFFNERQP